jgi:hypothetical protein
MRPVPRSFTSRLPGDQNAETLDLRGRSSKIYHCPNDKYYGKTKYGDYMTESAALAAGGKPTMGKSCAK